MDEALESAINNDDRVGEDPIDGSVSAIALGIMMLVVLTATWLFDAGIPA